jgi:hypothetical protein
MWISQHYNKVDASSQNKCLLSKSLFFILKSKLTMHSFTSVEVCFHDTIFVSRVTRSWVTMSWVTRSWATRSGSHRTDVNFYM